MEDLLEADNMSAVGYHPPPRAGVPLSGINVLPAQENNLPTPGDNTGLLRVDGAPLPPNPNRDPLASLNLP